MKLAIFAVLALGCVEPPVCPHADLAPLASPPAFAYVASDYASSAIGLLDAAGEVMHPAWLDSGTRPPGLVAALSGDVVLASSAPAPCVLTVIDRDAGVLSFLDVCGGAPLLAQIDVGPTFYANPQDALALDEHTVLVSRHTPNLHPDAAELERGNDLVVVDWRAQRVVSRVALSALDHVDDERMYARPARMVRLTSGAREVVIVGLARLSADFMRAGPGAVGSIDLAADPSLASPSSVAPSLLPIEGLVNCAEVDAVPGEPSMAVVTCQGATFGDPEGRRSGAGVASIALTDEGAEVRAVWRASEHRGAPVFNTWSVPLAHDRVVSVAMGDLHQHIEDHAGVIHLGAAAAPEVIGAADAFALGDGAYDLRTQLLLVPDANGGTIRRFAMGEPPMELPPVDAAGCRGLPPRELRLIVP